MNFDDNFSCVNTMHQCDRQTDRQTPGDSKDRALYLNGINDTQTARIGGYLLEVVELVEDADQLVEDVYEI